MDDGLRAAHRKYLETGSPEDPERLLAAGIRGGVPVDAPEMKELIEDPAIARVLLKYDVPIRFDSRQIDPPSIERFEKPSNKSQTSQRSL